MTAMTHAERQKRYRDRQSVTRDSSHDILLKILMELRLLRDFVTKSHVTIVPPNGSPSDSPSLTPLTPLSNLRLTSPKGDADFDRWWEGYPDKTGKGAARKAFAKALTKTSLDQLIEGVERYKRTKPLDRPWCNPATWLNQERWLDVPANAQPAATNGHSIEFNELRAKTLAELARKGMHVLPGSMT